jgi:hypothetical protein
MLGSSYVAVQLFAYREGHSSMELIIRRHKEGLQREKHHVIKGKKSKAIPVTGLGCL